MTKSSQKCQNMSLALTLQHVIVRVIGNGEQMGRHLVSPLTTVLRYDILGVDGQALVGVDHHTEET